MKRAGVSLLAASLTLTVATAVGCSKPSGSEASAATRPAGENPNQAGAGGSGSFTIVVGGALAFFGAVGGSWVAYHLRLRESARTRRHEVYALLQSLLPSLQNANRHYAECGVQANASWACWRLDDFRAESPHKGSHEAWRQQGAIAGDRLARHRARLSGALAAARVLFKRHRDIRESAAEILRNARPYRFEGKLDASAKQEGVRQWSQCALEGLDGEVDKALRISALERLLCRMNAILTGEDA